MVLEIALGIIIAVFILGLLEDYPQILYWGLGIVGILLAAHIWENIDIDALWEHIAPAVLVLVVILLFYFLRYCIQRYKSRKK